LGDSGSEAGMTAGVYLSILPTPLKPVELTFRQAFVII